MSEVGDLHVLIFFLLNLSVYEMCHFRETMLFMGICNFDTSHVVSAPVTLSRTKNYLQILSVNDSLPCVCVVDGV